MFKSKNKSSYILDAFEKGLKWVKNNTLNGGIIQSSTLQIPYPEVTGYFIPSLLAWGEKDLACSYGNWLLSIQTEEGAWQDLSLKTIYTFDTGQILKGLYALIPYDEKYEKAFLKGCDWLISQIDESGRIHTHSTVHFSSIGNEYIHIYAIEPLKLAGEKYGRHEYSDAAKRALSYYLSQEDLTNFDILSHFHAYIIESLIDLGEKERALDALNSLKKYQRSSGAVPAFANVRWVCLTAMLQYAVCYYKLGMLAEGNVFLDYAISKQNDSGGFYGGSGWFVTYFKKTEISWPVKYLLDAIQLKLNLEFAKSERAESFLSSINATDGRYLLLKETIESASLRSINEGSLISMLDIGCGKGRFIHNLLHDGFDLNVTAMDISDKLFKYLPECCIKKIGSICYIPLEDKTQNIVFCCEVLEHAVNTEAAIKELSRVCKPGGVVIVIDKDIERKKNLRLETWEQWFDKDYVASLMKDNNLLVEVRELETTDGPPICAWIGAKNA